LSSTWTNSAHGEPEIEINDRFHPGGLEQITDRLPALISYIDKDYYFRYNNQTYEEWLGVPISEITGRLLWDVLERDRLERILPYITRALHGEAVEYESEFDFPRIGRRWIQGKYTPDIAPDGSVRGIFVLVNDIHSRKVLETQMKVLLQDAEEKADELTAANGAKDAFLAMVSHELRTPLTIILGNSQVLMRNPDLLDSVERRQVSSDIHRESIRLSNIIENLLLMARFDNGQQLDPEPVILRRIAALVLADAARLANRKFETHFRREVRPVAGNATCIEQIIRNLVSNAEKYSPPSSVIDLYLEEDGTDLVFTVADRGAGVNPKDADQIFEAFYRSPESEKLAGVGVGLAVCKRLIDAMKGRIWYEPREGGGAKFSFALPKYDTAAA